YAWRASQQGDNIEAVFNYDMIGYTDAQPETLEVCGDTFCTPLIDHFIACADTYTALPVRSRVGIMVSDEGPFAFFGYPAIGMIEDYPVVNPYYHTQGDTIGAGFNSLSFCTEVTRAAVAALASKARPVGIYERDYVVAEPPIYMEIFPNPFRERAVIRYHARNGSKIQIEVYEATGRLVQSLLVSADCSPASNETFWDGRDNSGNKLPNGVYFLKLTTGSGCMTEKLLLLR
ncbi:T9SS type A sorting domain-containing protein, partial [candidate division WOR-3 bacterium]|nr:T9SS type A sorting domain-containing protein [candidate division WOR-3 bacterium]